MYLVVSAIVRCMRMATCIQGLFVPKVSFDLQMYLTSKRTKPCRLSFKLQVFRCSTPLSSRNTPEDLTWVLGNFDARISPEFEFGTYLQLVNRGHASAVGVGASIGAKLIRQRAGLPLTWIQQ